MEGSSVKCGWVYEQTSILKRFCQRWLILTSTTLQIYKRQNAKDLSQEIQLSSIKAVTRQKPHRDFFTFRVSTAQRDYQFFSHDQLDTEQWVKALVDALQQASVQAKGPTQQSEAETLQLLKGKFDQLKKTLETREHELLAANDGLFHTLQKQATAQDAKLSSGLSRLTVSFDQLTELLSTVAPGPQLMQKVKLPDEEDFSIQCNQPEVAVAPRVLKGLLVNHTRIAFVNPHELKITRSKITRALKWQYAGGKVDALTFSVNKSVQLTGVGLCRPYKPGRHLEVLRFAILSGSDTSSKTIYSHQKREQIGYDELCSIATLRIPPLALAAGQRYTAFFILAGGPTFKCVDCASRHAMRDAVTWEFTTTNFTSGYQSNRTDAICGPIAEFNFMLLK